MEPTRLFIAYASADEALRAELETHLTLLKREGLLDVWHDRRISAGSEWQGEIDQNLETAELVLLLVSSDFLASDYVWDVEIRRAMERREAGEARVIPVILRPCDWRSAPFAKLQALPTDGRPVVDWKSRDHGWLDVVRGLRSVLEAPVEKFAAPLSLSAEVDNIQLVGLKLVNIRCFERLELNLEVEGQPAAQVLLLGENASGKTTLLRAIALGLCPEGDAVALMKDVPSGFLRRGTPKGLIRVTLRRASDGAELRVTTQITRGSDSGSERVRQTTEPQDFPWGDIFVCGYGAQRANRAHAGYETYSARDALQALFDPETQLQNPELVLLRRTPEERAILRDRLLSILLLDAPEHALDQTSQGLELRGPWGPLPIDALSDGYRSTTQWVLDFLGWMIYAHRLEEGGGILLVDELEQHLHPRWQRHVVERLSQQFPKTQIFASTHTPLVASGAVDQEYSQLFRLEQNGTGVTARQLDKSQLAGRRADQVLASEAFGLVTSRSPKSEDELSRYVELLESGAEGPEVEQLGEKLRERLAFGETPVEQAVEKAVSETLERMLDERTQTADLEARRQLRALFRPESEG
jgi:energy-coupling factor transporter ATP-binding protein EcfA2